MNIYYVAAIWLGMALLASVVSIRIAIPAALVEIVVGALAGNIPGIREHVTQTDVVVFLASVGSLVLTFLAGAEIDPVSLRGHWKASLCIGAASFALPFVAALLFCGLVLGWAPNAAKIGGVALSTTSVAVVYAVMVETGLNRHDLGKLILAACFVTDLGTVLALGGLFASYGWLLLVFVAVSAVTVALLPRLLRLGDQVLRPPGLRAGDQAAARGAGPERPGHPGGQRGRPARLCGRAGGGRGVPARPGADGPAPLDRLRPAHPVLLPAGRHADLRARPGHRRRGDRAAAGGQADREADRRVADGRRVQDDAPGAHLHDAADGHRAHVRVHRRTVRADPPPDQPGAVHRTGHRGDPLGIRADDHRAATVPAGHRGRRRGGGPRRGGHLDHPPLAWLGARSRHRAMWSQSTVSSAAGESPDSLSPSRDAHHMPRPNQIRYHSPHRSVRRTNSLPRSRSSCSSCGVMPRLCHGASW